MEEKTQNQEKAFELMVNRKKMMRQYRETYKAMSDDERDAMQQKMQDMEDEADRLGGISRDQAYALAMAH